MRHFIATAIVGATLAISATAGSAATVTLGGTAFAPGPVTAPTSITGTVDVNVTGTVSGTRKDPWAATAFADTGAYTSVRAGSSASYTFGNLKKSIDLLWGTPDSYNFIEFYLAGVLVDSIGGADTGITDFADQTTNQFVTVASAFDFDSVTYRSTTANAFEFATVSPVPVPAAGLLLLGALGGIAALRRRKA